MKLDPINHVKIFLISCTLISSSVCASTLFQFNGTCTSTCDQIGLNNGDAVNGIVGIADSAATAGNIFQTSDITQFKIVAGTYSFDYPSSPTEFIPISNDGGKISADGTGLDRILVRGGPTPDLLFRFPDVINTTDTWRMAVCQLDCIGKNVLAIATGTGQFSIVPIPPAILLFGSGLLGLIGMSRHKKAS